MNASFMPSHGSIVVFSGGTAANHLVDVFESIRKSKDCPISYIIPISDNGGSSSELIRVFGGPGIGDVRSRLVRLIPHLPSNSPGYKEREAIRGLFNHRLSSTDARKAKMQWMDIVEGISPLWKDISSAKKELIRSFFNVVNLEITKRSRPPSSTFDFTSASVGNLFLTAARLFTGSFESAIYMLGSVCGVEDEGVKVIPSINSTFSHHIAAGLEDTSVIVGQNAISHPSPDVGASPPGTTVVQTIMISDDNANANPSLSLRPVHRSSHDHYYGDEQEQDEEEEEEEDANLPGTLPTLRTRNIKFNKDAHLNEDLPSRIERIWYINPYGQEILPPANPRAITAINNAQAVIYSIGSLYTSLAPSLILRGIGDALRRNNNSSKTASSSSSEKPPPRIRILILKGSLDREVGPQPPHPAARGKQFSAVDFVEGIVRACEQSRGNIWNGSENGTRDDEASPNSTNNNYSNASTGTNTPAHRYSARSTYLSHLHETNPNATAGSRPRPGLLSSKSAELVPLLSHRYRHPQHLLNPHLYPPPLLASTANSRAPSREPSPHSRSSRASTPPSPSRSPTNTDSTPAPAPSAVSPSPAVDPIYTDYITHVIHLPNTPYTPYVDPAVLRTRYGIETVGVHGRTDADGLGMRYDAAALKGAIEGILGGVGKAVVATVRGEE